MRLTKKQLNTRIINNMKTISLENAKKLHEITKERGVKLPDSEYFVFDDGDFGNKKHWEENDWKYGKCRTIKFYDEDENKFDEEANLIETYKAFLTDELLEWLSTEISIRKDTNGKFNVITYFYRDNSCKDRDWYYHEADTPADALCLLAIELIKKGIIK